MVPLPHSLPGGQAAGGIVQLATTGQLGLAPFHSPEGSIHSPFSSNKLGFFPVCHSNSSVPLPLPLPLQALSRFPTLCSHRKGDGQSLKGAIVYHDGQFNDSRLAVVLACTAAAAGAAVVNHCEAVRLLKVGTVVIVCWWRCVAVVLLPCCQSPSLIIRHCQSCYAFGVPTCRMGESRWWVPWCVTTCRARSTACTPAL